MDPTHDTVSALAGRRMVVSVIIAVLGLSLGAILISMLARHTGPKVAEVLRVLIEVILCIGLYRGTPFARWFTVVLLAIAAALAFVATHKLWPAIGSYLLIAYGVAYCACIAALVFPASVRAHFAESNLAPANNALERERGQ